MIRHRFTDVRHGDLAVARPADELASRRTEVVDLPWSWLYQEHGARVHVVTAPGEHAGAHGDALVTTVPGAAVAIGTADCGAVLLDGEGAVGVVHVGWRGLLAGVIEATAQQMGALGWHPRRAVVGPMIRARCYEFDGPGTAQLVDRYGPSVQATTAWGTPALDLAAGIERACTAADIAVDLGAGTCTACSPVHWSHRARADLERQVLVAWIEP